ncbi:MAG: ATP synthase F1 subunit epsilon [Lachnospiraceae bacterium]|jgi:F-type H+-transporting ATPase subunit epsilon|nr:ATP synthase F1 subunit epsilon [Lachnospiraceae bacterium]MBP5276361.1 ATP synthase F1 subunit epsilon [Lachnospiraceae bacterium]MCR4697474.1 ATP synthase F1 subunit epsilon [Lachnospiraceae bacterium]
MNVFMLHILAAERNFYEGECESLIVPITDGQYGIQANHKNMVAAIVPGILEFSKPEGERVTAAVSQGILIVADNDVRLLVDTIETPDEIDENRARAAADAAKEAILQKKSIQEYKTAQMRIAREMNRLKLKGKGNQ